MKESTTSRTNHPRRTWLQSVLVLVLLVASVQQSAAFQTIKNTMSPNTALYAWSMPHDNSFAFRTWYNEYNPTARVTVYNDPDPIERYTFVSVGSEQQASYSMNNNSNIRKRYTNPIKRAWRRRSLRRILAAAARKSS